MTPPELPPRANSTLRQHYHRLSGASVYSAVTWEEARYLHHVVSALHPRSTGETGFASGSSALAILTALRPGSQHIAIDPYQPAFKREGVRALRRYVGGVGQAGPSFVHLNETAAFGLAWLYRTRHCFDFFFMDDGHKFDDNFVELYYVARMLSFGGVLVLHDTYLDSMRATVAFVSTNLRYFERMPPQGRFATFVKRFPDNRPWDHFVNFDWFHGGRANAFSERRPNYTNPACHRGPRDSAVLKTWKWCKSRVFTAEDCRSEYFRSRCFALCNGC